MRLLRRSWEHLAIVGGLLFVLWLAPGQTRAWMQEPLYGLVVLILADWQRRLRKWLEQEKGNGSGPPSEG